MADKQTTIDNDELALRWRSVRSLVGPEEREKVEKIAEIYKDSVTPPEEFVQFCLEKGFSDVTGLWRAILAYRAESEPESAPEEEIKKEEVQEGEGEEEKKDEEAHLFYPPVKPISPETNPPIEAEKPKEQPQTRFEQMKQAGERISEEQKGNSSWGTPEPFIETSSQIPPTQSTIPTATPFLNVPSTRKQEIGSGIVNELNRGAGGFGRRFPNPPASFAGSFGRRIPNPFSSFGGSFGRSISRPFRNFGGSFGRGIPNPKNLIPGYQRLNRARQVFFLGRFFFAILGGSLGSIFIVTLLLVFMMGFGGGTGFGGQEGPTPSPSIAPSPSASPGPTRQPDRCEANPRDCLRTEFNFIAKGDPGAGILSDIYKLLSEVTVSGRYGALLRTSGPTEVVFENSSLGGCPGRVQAIGGGRSRLTLSNYSLRGCPRETRKSRLIHETGHIIRNGHMRLFQIFESQAYFPKDGGCYKRDARFSPPYFIMTYNTNYAADIGVSISGSNETFAEFTALYVIPQGGYPRICPIGYNWTKDNIFKNYAFR